MPLHLLGKKSWNVYNRANIENVRRDEAIAKAAEEAEEERMQALDAERRMQILRGETSIPPAAATAPDSLDPKKLDGEERGWSDRKRKPRKKPGEDDADFEIRIARQQFEQATNISKQCALPTVSSLKDSKGFFSLFPEERDKIRKHEKNPEAEKEAARKKKELEDQYTMRFSNATGLRQDPGQSPWYSTSKWGDEVTTIETNGKDVWGNEDPRRKEREQKRMVSNDPLALMKAGARKAREVEKERQGWIEDRNQEKDLEAHSRKKRRRSHHRDHADLKIHEPSPPRNLARYEKREDPGERHHRHKYRKRESRHKNSDE